MPPYTVEANGKTVHFEAPAGASQDQLKTLAARALKQAMPKESFARPVLEKRLRQPAKDQGTISATPWSLSGAITDKVAGALSAFGMDEGAAQRRGHKVTDFLNDLTPVGGLVEADQARQAFGQGNYLGAAGHGALAALSAIPDGGGAAAKAMFLGVAAKTADKAALKRAEEMLAHATEKNPVAAWDGSNTRKHIWQETGWFQGADKKWRFEVPDNEMYLDDASDTGGSHLAENARAGRRVPIGEVVGHQALYNNYPRMEDVMGIDRGNLGAGTKGSFSPKAALVAFDEGLTVPEARSTIAHELQHFVQDQEGFARGGMTGIINSQAMSEIDAVNKRLGELARGMDATRGEEKAALQREYDQLMQHKLTNLVPQAQIDPYEGYRRLAGEVEARNVQTRLDMTPGQRREYAPWETEDVPRDMQFVLWHGE